MALTWNWEDKFAEATYSIKNEDGTTTEYTCNWYDGNAWMIETYEEGDTYTVPSFWCDESHMKDCLGLSKGHEDNMYSGELNNTRIIKVTIWRDKTPHFKKIAAALTAAVFPEGITIEIR